MEVKGHREYTVSEDGTVIRMTGGKRPGKPIKQSFHCVKGKKYPNGYNYITFQTKDAVDMHGEHINLFWPVPVAVHRIAAFAFCPNPMNYPEVNHIDGNKLNNHYTNLEWVTHSANIRHSYLLGRTIPTGAEHWNYGKKAGLLARLKMREKKLGKLHPKYTGFYVVNGGKFYSAREAGEKTGINLRTVIRWCKRNINGCAFVPDPNRLF